MSDKQHLFYFPITAALYWTSYLGQIDLCSHLFQYIHLFLRLYCDTADLRAAYPQEGLSLVKTPSQITQKSSYKATDFTTVCNLAILHYSAN